MCGAASEEFLNEGREEEREQTAAAWILDSKPVWCTYVTILLLHCNQLCYFSVSLQAYPCVNLQHVNLNSTSLHCKLADFSLHLQHLWKYPRALMAHNKKMISGEGKRRKRAHKKRKEGISWRKKKGGGGGFFFFFFFFSVRRLSGINTRETGSLFSNVSAGGFLHITPLYFYSARRRGAHQCSISSSSFNVFCVIFTLQHHRQQKPVRSFSSHSSHDQQN